MLCTWFIAHFFVSPPHTAQNIAENMSEIFPIFHCNEKLLQHFCQTLKNISPHHYNFKLLMKYLLKKWILITFRSIVETFCWNVPISLILIMFPNDASNAETLFFYIIILKFYFRNFITLRKMLFLQLNIKILPTFTVNYLNCLSLIFLLNLFKTHDVTWPQKYNRSLVSGSATAKTFMSIYLNVYSFLFCQSVSDPLFWIPGL